MPAGLRDAPFRTLPHVLSISRVLFGLLCLLLGGVLLGRAGRLAHPRDHLDRPSGAWLTARERQRQDTSVRVLRMAGTAAVVLCVLLGLQVHGRLTS